MYFAILFFIELFILFLLSRSLTNYLFTFFYRTTKSKSISIYLMSLLFLPGTVVHELSHMLMAILLQVQVGNMELFPKLIGENLKMGSVQIAKCDPLRRFLIGAAPFLFGTLITLGIFFFTAQNNLFDYKLTVIIISYLVFEIGNTMFSSKKDMEGAIELLVVILFITILFYLIGFRLPALNPNIIFTNPIIKQTFQKGSLYLLAPIGINIMIICIFRFFKR